MQNGRGVTVTETLRWDLYGNDRLSDMLSKLAKVVETTGREFDRVSSQAASMGKAVGDTERHVSELGNEFDSTRRQGDELGNGLDRTARDAEALGSDLQRTEQKTNTFGNEAAQAGRQTNQLGDELQTVGRRADNMGSRMSNARGMSGGLSSAFGGLRGMAGELSGAFGMVAGAAATLGVLSTVASAVTNGIKAAAANETALMTFKVMLGSAEKAKAFYDSIIKFAAVTPFDVPTLRDAASQLLAVGVNAQRVIPIMAALGDAAAGMGKDSTAISMAVLALGQMVGKGKVQGDDVKQLINAGIPAWEALAATLKVPVATAMEMVTAGKVKADTMLKAIETRAGTTQQKLKGMMDEQSRTAEGMWSTLKDTTTQTLASMAAPFMPGIKAGLMWLSEAVPKIAEKLQGFGKKFSGIFAGSTIPAELKDALRKVGDELLPKINAGFDSLAAYVTRHKADFEQLGHVLANIVIPVLGLVAGAIIDMTFAFAEFELMIITHIWPAFKWFEDKFLTWAGFVLDSAGAAFGWIPGIGPKIKQAADDFDKESTRIRLAMDDLDGTTANLNIILNERMNIARGTTIYAPGGSSMGEHSGSHHATGGWAPAGVITTSEQGSEQIILPRPGYVIPANGRPPGFEDGGGTVAPVTINLDGYAVWQGLLRFKSRTGKPSLGLA